VLALLLRFSEPTSGRIVVAGRDLSAIDPAAWRRRIAFVPQRPTLFRGTVADNIRLGDPGADDERVRTAAELAGAHDFVCELPGGYETLVGDGGRQVSAGQKRRLALARAFLRDAPLVLLDEPTADLDRLSAAAVVDAIELLQAGRTVLLVTHDVDIAATADRVVRLDGGHILEPAAEAA
jgi:ABC-type multidrug transport system fused ATPase/permease subunit